MKILSRFPSYNYIFKNAMDGFARFPFALISAAVATIAAVLLLEENFDSIESQLQKILMVAALGLPFFLVLVAFAEKRLWSKKNNILLQLAGAVLLVIYYLFLPDDIIEALIHFNRFMLLYIGMHFLFAFLPFTGKNEINAFWQYNKELMLRIFLSVLYSGVLFVGLAIALAAADHLFGFDIKEIRYPQLWFLIVGIFNTWVFIAGVPNDLNNLGTITNYPKGLKIFTQYILLPLVGLYFIILFTYEIKIIFTWNWPKGWVSHLVLWFSVVGILSMLLLYPLREKAENRWIQVFGKWFYFALVPLIPMLFFAIIKRISEYGFTENRYFVLVMAIGLALVVFYFIISKRKDIRIIPIVLCCLAFLSTFGPWSAFSVSATNQQARLDELLIKNNIFVDGSIQKAPDEITFDSQKEMSSIVKYLNEFHGPDAFSLWFEDGTLDSMPADSRSAEIAMLMGFQLIYGRYNSENGLFFSYFPEGKAVFNISDYDYLISFDALSNDGTGSILSTYEIGNYYCYLSISQENTALKLKLLRSDSGDICDIDIDLIGLLSELKTLDRDSKLPIDKFNFISNCGDFGVRVIFQNISGYRTAEKYNLYNLKGQLLIREP